MANPRHWRENPSRYNLLATRCGVCSSIYFPPRAICPHCRRKSMGKMEPYRLSGRGKVYSYTVVHDAMPDFSMMKPYIMAMVEMQEGVRLTGQIVDCEPEQVGIGMDVETTFRKLGEEGSSGIIRYGYKFRPLMPR